MNACRDLGDTGGYVVAAIAFLWGVYQRRKTREAGQERDKEKAAKDQAVEALVLSLRPPPSLQSLGFPPAVVIKDDVSRESEER